MPVIAEPLEPDKGQGAPRAAELVVGQDQFRFAVVEPTEGPKRYVRILPGGHGQTYVSANGGFVESLNGEIYDSLEAAALVEDARQTDPMFCPVNQANRERAVELYEKAIGAAPNAKINAPLADRVAQLYAFYGDKEKKVTPIRSKATQWWNRCVESTNPKQLLWARAQMGLASMAVIAGDSRSALATYNKILDMDVTEVELPDWKTWPDGNSDRDEAALGYERKRLRESVDGIKARAAEKQFYVLCRIDKSAALDALQNVGARYKGTQAGDRASNIMAEIRKKTKTDPWALPDLMATNTTEEKSRAAPPLQDEPPKARVAGQAPAAAVSGRHQWAIGVAAFATFAAAFLAAGIVRIMRRKRLTQE